MALKTCTGTTSQPYVHVQVRLSQAATVTATGADVQLVQDFTGLANGTYSISLQATNDLTPNGTYYTVTEFLGTTDNTFNVQVPQTAGPFAMTSILVGTPTASPTPNHVSTLTVDGALTATNGPVTLPSHSVADSALSTNVMTLDGVQTSTGAKVFSGGIVASAITVSGSPYAQAAGILPGEEVTAINPYHAKAYGVRSDGQFVIDGVMNGTTGVLTSVSGKFAAADVGKLCLVPGAGAAGALLTTTIASYQSATQVTLAAVSQTAVATAYVTWGTEDTAAWVALYAALPAGGKVIIPWGYSLYRGSFMGGIAKSLTLEGLGASEVFQQSDVFTSAPTLAPYVRGSVLVQCQAAQNGIDITGTTITVHRRGFAIKFADGIKFQNTGHGINSSPAAADGSGGFVIGEWGSKEENVLVFGHDGNHYGRWTRNSLNTLREHFHSYGGGVMHDECNSGVSFFGNLIEVAPYGELFCGGSAHGYDLAGIVAAHPINLTMFLRPQVNCVDLHTSYPGATITNPTNAQYLWKTTHGLISLITIDSPDLEGNSFANPADFGLSTDSVFVRFGEGNIPAGTTLPAQSFNASALFTGGFGSLATESSFGRNANGGTGGAVKAGDKGTTEAYLDVSSSATNAGLHLRSKGSGPIDFNPNAAGVKVAIDINGTTVTGALARSRQTPTETVLVSGVDATAGDIVSVTLTAARVVGAPLNPATGRRLTFILTQGGAGGFAVTWNATFKKTWADTGNTTGKLSSISYVYDGTNWVQDSAQAPYV